MQGAKWIITSKKPEPSTIVEILSKHEVNHTFISSSYADGLAKLISEPGNTYKFPHLKVISAGGSPISKYTRLTFKRFLPSVRLLNLYGLSEAGALIAGKLQSLDPQLAGPLYPNVEGKVRIFIL
jgi:acyl-coenzyme A synthetase/AMP-(fatty) acid ligase